MDQKQKAFVELLLSKFSQIGELSFDNYEMQIDHAITLLHDCAVERPLNKGKVFLHTASAAALLKSLGAMITFQQETIKGLIKDLCAQRDKTNDN